MNVSFVIPALNEGSVLGRCLNSIRGQRLESGIAIAEIIIIDAGSSDDTVTIAESFRCHVVTADPGNISRSRNRGAGKAIGDLIAFVDADTVLDADWLRVISSHFHDQNVVCTAAGLAKPRPDASWVERSWYRMTHRSRDAESPRSVAWLPSFNLLVRRDAFERAGGFDESLVTCEDADLGYRLAKTGTLLMDGRVSVRHLGESRTLSEFARREAWRARGNWSMLLRHGSAPRELISTLMPPVFLISSVAGVLCGLLSIAWNESRFGLAGAAFAVVAVGLPLLMLLRSRIALRDFTRCGILAVTWLLARTVGMLLPAHRVPRESMATPEDTRHEHHPDPAELSVG